MLELEKRFLELFNQSQYQYLFQLNWYVAISSGVDSLSLLSLLKTTFSQRKIQAIYLNHQLSQDSEKWQKNCQNICDELKVPLMIRKLEGLEKYKKFTQKETHKKNHQKTHQSESLFKSFETSARGLRNQAFLEIMPKQSCLFLAHHQDDQVETFIFRLLRGAYYQGLSAMDEHSFLDSTQSKTQSQIKSQIHLARPLLSLCTKKELYDYAKAKKIKFFEDESNFDLRYKRNLIRHKIIPNLEKVHPNAKNILLRQVEHHQQSNQVLAELAREDIQKNLVSKKLASYLSIEKLRDFCEFKQFNQSQSNQSIQSIQSNYYRLTHLIYHFAIENWDYYFESRASLDSFIKQFIFDSKKLDKFTLGKLTLIHYQGLILAFKNNQLILKPKLKNKPQTNSTHILPIHLKHGFLEYQPSAQDEWGIDFKLLTSLKVFENQEFKEVKLAQKKHHQSLKKLFQEYNIASFFREYYPFLALDNKLAVLPNIGICDNLTPTQKSSNPSQKVKIIWNYY